MLARSAERRWITWYRLDLHTREAAESLISALSLPSAAPRLGTAPDRYVKGCRGRITRFNRRRIARLHPSAVARFN